jgi:hypothetical protein
MLAVAEVVQQALMEPLLEMVVEELEEVRL